MAITIRSFKPFDLIVSFDSALDAVPEHLVQQYVETHDIEVLELDKHPCNPTVFSCSHLTPEDDYLVGQFVDATTHLSSARELVKRHVHGVKNLTFDGLQNPFQPGTGGRLHLKEEAVNQLPTNVVTEISSVLIQLTNGADYRPFSSGGIWLRERNRRLRSTIRTGALSAAIDGVSEGSPSS